MVRERLQKFRITASKVNDDDCVTKSEYIDLVGDFKSSFPKPIVETIERKIVVREDLLECGSKARAGELLVSRITTDEIVYVQPRYGFAGVSLTKLAKMYDKKLTLFMPASKEVSEHQAWCIEHGCKPIFKRIAAMPNLNKAAEEYALKTGAFFIPLGLRHRLVTAMIVKTADEIFPHPDAFWTAISTGVLNRALQIAWPNAYAYGVAVARNIQDGEKGSAMVYSSSLDFHQDAKDMPPFDSCSNYDAKVWNYVEEGELFWNVAGNIKSTIDKSKIKSNVPW